MDDSTEGLDHHAAIGLGVVRRTDLPDLTVKAELLTGKCQGGAPLARTSLGRQALYTCLSIVKGLGDSGVWLV